MEKMRVELVNPAFVTGAITFQFRRRWYPIAYIPIFLFFFILHKYNNKIFLKNQLIDTFLVVGF